MAGYGYSRVVGRNECILPSIYMVCHRQFLTVLAILISSVSLLQAETITFDPPLNPGAAQYLPNRLEDGMLFTSPNGFVQYDSGMDRVPDNGSAYLKFDYRRTLEFRSIDSTPFTLTSIDLAEYSTLFAEPKTITIVGHKTNGAIIRRRVILDGVMDGPGPLIEFETFLFGEEFSNLSYVEIPTGRYTMDNVVVESGAGGATLMGLEIIGPQQVFEGDLVPYEAVVTYGNGFELNVTTTTQLFVQPEDNGSFDANGILSTMNIDEPQPITLYTQYTEDAMRVDAELTVQVLPSRTFYVPSEYDTIQSAIDDANNGYVIIVEDGVYSGPGNRDIDFLGKAITVRSRDPDDPEIVAKTIIDCEGTEASPHRGFCFHSEEGQGSQLAGLTIMNGYESTGGAIYSSGSSPTVRQCVIVGNTATDGGGIHIVGGSQGVLVENCIIVNNQAVRGRGGGIYLSCPPKRRDSLNTRINNCTIAGNRASYSGGGVYVGSGFVELENSIIWHNRAEWDLNLCLHVVYDARNPPFCTVSYCNIEGGPDGVKADYCMAWDTGAIDIQPLFVDPGYWDTNTTPHDVNDDFWVIGIGDYHLKSQGWRWDDIERQWVTDDVTSPCIDAGDPGAAIGQELVTAPGDPNGPWNENIRINMGAYGGTAEASLAAAGFRPPIQAWNPQPEDGAIIFSDEVVLSWSAIHAVPYDVFFGPIGSGQMQYCGRQTEITFDPGLLEYGKTYSWRIDEILPTGTIEGEVWEFAVSGPK